MNKRLSKAEAVFLNGPASRWKEFRYTLGVVAQFIRGFRALHFLNPCVTIFGSARFGEDHPYYQLAREVAAGISKLGFTIMTGGGPGIMEAANRGARDVDGPSIGCNIVLPKEQRPNPFLDKFVDIEFFFVRKEILRKYSVAFVVMPGGFGTLDEFFETLTLIQTKKMPHFPVVIMGLEYHKDLIAHLERMVAEKTIGEEDLRLLLCTDSVEEAVKHIETYANDNPDFKIQTRPKPIWLLGEGNLG